MWLSEGLRKALALGRCCVDHCGFCALSTMADQSELRRLWVGEFGEGVSKEDICNLVGKVCPVVESYAPGRTATGVTRRFVIVVV